MARGKHARAKRNRDLRHLQEREQELDVALTEERALLAEEERIAERAVDLQAKLRAAIEDRDGMLALTLEALRAEVDRVEPLAHRARAAREQVHDAWDSLSLRLINYHGGGNQGLRKYMSLTGRAGWINTAQGELRPAMAARLAVARGQADASTFPDEYEDLDRIDEFIAEGMAGVLRPMLTVGAAQQVETLEERERDIAEALDAEERAELAQRARRAVESSAFDVSYDAVFSWHPLSLVSSHADGHVTLPPSLGAAAPFDEGTYPDGYGAAAHARLVNREMDDMARRDAVVAAAVNRIPSPWSALPRFPRPGDAVLLRHLYASAATGQWLRLVELGLPGKPTAREDTWADPNPSQAARVFADAAVQLRRAVPFWLPSAQVRGFVDSEPISDAELEDVRLPFDATLLTFAEPLRIAPSVTNEDLPHDLDVLRKALIALERLEERPTYYDILEMSFRFDKEANPPDLAEVVAHWGAKVEGVLLLADRDGGLRDEFAWCIALGEDLPQVHAGRFVLPALRSRLAPALRDVVVNLAAAASWGHWHEPDTELELPAAVTMKDAEALAQDKAFLQREPHGGAGAVRVLNVARTGGGMQRTTTPTGRTVAPHLRRGHWRRQHHGPRGSLVKRVRVAPVLVNASRLSDVVPQVYRLPVEAAVVADVDQRTI